MSDRHDRNPEHDPLDEDETMDDVEMTLDEQADAEAAADEPFPQGPNEDRSNDANHPAEAAMPRMSDDDDLDPEGSGLTGTRLRGVYESMARRGDLARRLEDLVRDVEEWAREDGTDQAAWISETLADAYEQLDTPPEDTDLEPMDVEQAEASNLGEPRSTQRET